MPASPASTASTARTGRRVRIASPAVAAVQLLLPGPPSKALAGGGSADSFPSTRVVDRALPVTARTHRRWLIPEVYAAPAWPTTPTHSSTDGQATLSTRSRVSFGAEGGGAAVVAQRLDERGRMAAWCPGRREHDRRLRGIKTAFRPAAPSESRLARPASSWRGHDATTDYRSRGAPPGASSQSRSRPKCRAAQRCWRRDRSRRTCTTHLGSSAEAGDLRSCGRGRCAN